MQSKPAAFQVRSSDGALWRTTLVEKPTEATLDATPSRDGFVTIAYPTLGVAILLRANGGFLRMSQTPEGVKVFGAAQVSFADILLFLRRIINNVVAADRVIYFDQDMNTPLVLGDGKRELRSFTGMLDMMLLQQRRAV